MHISGFFVSSSFLTALNFLPHKACLEFVYYLDGRPVLRKSTVVEVLRRLLFSSHQTCHQPFPSPSLLMKAKQKADDMFDYVTNFCSSLQLVPFHFRNIRRHSPPKFYLFVFGATCTQRMSFQTSKSVGNTASKIWTVSRRIQSNHFFPVSSQSFWSVLNLAKQSFVNKTRIAVQCTGVDLLHLYRPELATMKITETAKNELVIFAD